MSSLITQGLIAFARSEFRLDWDGIHGAPHWSRVRHNGLLLAEHTGANTRVVEYFAFIHDLGRVGIRPDPFRLCNEAARQPALLSEAYERSLA
jgi:uncharacterized protein